MFLRPNLQKKHEKNYLHLAAWLRKTVFFKYDFQLILYQDIHPDILGQVMKIRQLFLCLHS